MLERRITVCGTQRLGSMTVNASRIFPSYRLPVLCLFHTVVKWLFAVHVNHCYEAAFNNWSLYNLIKKYYL